MVDNRLSVVEQSFPVEFTENFQTIDPGAFDEVSGTQIMPVNDIATQDSIERIFDILITTEDTGLDGEIVLSHRNVTVPITPPSSPISINDFVTGHSVDFLNAYILERTRTPTDIIYDVFYVSIAPVGVVDRKLTVVTYTLEPGDTLPVFAISTSSVIAQTVLRSKEGNKRTYDVFVFSQT